MARPPKTAEIIRLEKKTHATKRDLAARERAEKSVMTGLPLKEPKEVRENPAAHKAWARNRKLFRAINKDDDIYGAALARYCLNTAELEGLNAQREKYLQMAAEAGSNEAALDFYKLADSLDKKRMTLQDKLAAFEDRNAMTIAAALRVVPKKADKEKNPLMEALNG